MSEHLSGPPLYYYYYCAFLFTPFSFFSILFYFLLPSVADPPPGFYSAHADILTPRPPPPNGRRPAHPQHDRHTRSIGPKTDFIPYRSTHRARVYIGPPSHRHHRIRVNPRQPPPHPLPSPPTSHFVDVDGRLLHIDDNHRIPLERRRRSYLFGVG